MTNLLDDNAILASGQNVFNAESEALSTQANELNGEFIKAVKAITSCKGRVIISGMGKSGHIARKMAATFASTGTPSFFVHPGEASHGDLGMITVDDVVIGISSSGESKELGDLIAFTARFNIPLLSITRKAESSLGVAATILLQLPNIPEVGGLGLAPTTSTTMTLALGDALAVAALECKGFTAEDFGNFHPGGKLGQNLLRVEDVMHKGNDIPLAKAIDTMAHVLVVMTEKRFGCAGITDDNGLLVGIITDGDLRRHMGAGLTQETAQIVMTQAPMTMSPNLLAAEAVGQLNETNRTQIFVVDDANKPIGILHIHDLLRAGVV